jgi:ribonuclease E
MTDQEQIQPSAPADQSLSSQAPETTPPADAAPPAEGETQKRRSRPRRRGGRGRKSKAKAAGTAAEAATPAEPLAGAEPPADLQSEFMAAFQDNPLAGFSDVPPPAPAPAEPPAAPAAREPRSRGPRGGRAKARPEPEAPKAAPGEDEDDELSSLPGKKRRQKMFISVLPGEQMEVVVAEEGKVLEYYVEMHHLARTKGNIYKGVIHNVDPNLQAAFINYGAERNGFLQIDEIHPEYYQGGYTWKKGQRYPLIQKVLKPGQEILVQVVKEPTGKKGAFLSTYLSLPGRHFVFSVGNDQSGVSRKIEDEKERARLKEVIESLDLPEGLGLIARTAGVGQSKAELTRDYKYLSRLWTEIRKKAQDAPTPSLVYQELDLAARAVRDYLTADVSEVWVDDAETCAQIKEYAALAFPRSAGLVKLHTDTDRSLWERFNLTRQIEQIYSREVTLPSGGRIVIDPTEALTAVDVNSGKIGGAGTFQKMALTTNMEAAETVAQQLRLRDIGGQVVVDFIEMKDPKHCREVEKVMKNALKTDRARTDVGRISAFGLMEIVRQRLGSSALSVSTEPCPCCEGAGIRRNMEWQSLLAIKEMFRLLRRPGCPQPFSYACERELALYLLNHKREKLMELGKRFDNTILVDILE